MEESIGKVWDKFLNKKVNKFFDYSKIYFTDISKSLHLFYHLMGGEKGKEIKITDKRFIDTSRSLLEKISGQGEHFFLPWQDEKALYLPSVIAYFPQKEQNLMLYFWLVAMSMQTNIKPHNIVVQNKVATQYLLNRYEGFKDFYVSSCKDIIKKNSRLSFLNSLDKDLINNNSNNEIYNYPVPFWIYPSLFNNNKATKQSDIEKESEQIENERLSKSETLEMKKQAEQIDDKKETDGLMAFIPATLMSILEKVNVDRSEDDSFDEDALYNAEDLDEITLGQKKANLSSRIKMDIDLSVDTQEEYPLGNGHFIDEWNYKRKDYLKKYVCIKPIITTNIKPLSLPKKLGKMVNKIQSQLDLMQIDRIKNDNLSYGDEINMDTWIEYLSNQNKSGHHQKFYENFEKKTRDMSTLILADISLSTEAGITQEIRIIDMIKDGLMVFSESLQRLQDRFAIYAFSSLKNTNVRFHIIKNFKEKYTDLIRGRIDAIKPGYYTRLGAAIRESTKILEKVQSQNKLLLIVSDGKPNDVDRYDGRYGIEDTKKAIEEVTKKGITPFCITIDLEAKDYLSYIFGKNGYVIVRNSKKLPKVLPEIYLNLTK